MKVLHAFTANFASGGRVTSGEVIEYKVASRCEDDHGVS
jgi:hypothetical protein